MGRPKALLTAGAGGETFFDRVTRTLLEGGVEGVVVVLGAGGEAIRAAIGADRPHVRIVTNLNHEQGQLSSLVAGLDAVDGPGVSAALVTLIDAPLIAAATVEALIRAHLETGALIVRPVSQGRHGHPVIFARPLFEELRQADPLQGAKSVVHAHVAQILEIPVQDEGAFIDIDTPEDYERWVTNAFEI
jgi:molybdenum cofactor cytidylyltransferase